MPPTDPALNAHEKWMAKCISLAKRGQGHASPNPLVGSVLVDEQGNELGVGWHEVYGSAHAERNAVADAESRHNAAALKKATLYVNLEPCSHYGKTPPCAELVIEKRIPRVVIGMVDPSKKVSGRGIKMLQEAGVEVCVGVLQAACERLNEPFTQHQQTGRPLVTLKMAQTLDGQIATATGDSQWVSGAGSRKLVHHWRATLDAVLVGRGTALADNPSLTVRHVDGRQPYRIVLDRTGSLPASMHLFSDEHAGKTIAVTASAAKPAYANQLQQAGGELIHAPVTDGKLNLLEVLQLLGKSTNHRKGLQTVLVEAGPGLATALFQKNLIDRFYLFIAPKLVGKGTPTLHGLNINLMKDAYQFAASEWQPVGEDMLFKGYRRAF
ncbi:MAG: bifunctional diaminohydroxyphosphoribosylaminopyrimidine deaminase/5-amino-6-(5-phosphoribosylamino)uracil reductase RibD [Bacteroidota bacterium]